MEAAAMLELSYFDGDGDLVLECQPAALTMVEQRRLDAALLHPSMRAEVEAELAEVAMVSSQAGRKTLREGPSKKCKLTRQERVKEWREHMGGRTVAKHLAALVPYAKSGKKKMKKHIFKMVKGKITISSKKKKKSKGANGLKAAIGYNCCG